MSISATKYYQTEEGEYENEDYDYDSSEIIQSNLK